MSVKVQEKESAKGNLCFRCNLPGPMPNFVSFWGVNGVIGVIIENSQTVEGVISTKRVIFKGSEGIVTIVVNIVKLLEEIITITDGLMGVVSS